MNLKENNPGCDCCEACRVWLDEFDNGTTIDEEWDQRSGTWLQSGGVLGTVDDDSLIIRDQDYGLGAQINVILDGQTPDNRSVRLVLDYLDDANYHFAEFNFEVARIPNPVLVRLYKRTGSVNNLIRESAGNNLLGATPFLSMFACLYGGTFTFRVDGGPFIQAAISDTTTEHGGTKGGLGVGVAPQGFEAAQLHEKDGDKCGACTLPAEECGPIGQSWCGDPGQAAPAVTVYIPQLITGGPLCLACENGPSDANFVTTWQPHFTYPPPSAVSINGCQWWATIDGIPTMFCINEGDPKRMFIRLYLDVSLTLPATDLDWILNVEWRVLGALAHFNNPVIIWRGPAGPAPANCVNPGTQILPFEQIAQGDCNVNGQPASIFV